MTRLDPSSTRQRERLVGAIVVLVGVAVLVLSVFALFKAGDGPGSDVSGPGVTLPAASGSTTPTASGSGGTASSSGSTGASTTPTPTPTSSGPTAATLPLVVLNNTGESGLASTAAATFAAGGWTVTDTANWSQSTISTCAYYDPDVAGAQAAAEALMAQFPAIKRTAEKYGALPAGPVVVVLTDDYTAQ